MKTSIHCVVAMVAVGLLVSGCGKGESEGGSAGGGRHDAPPTAPHDATPTAPGVPTMPTMPGGMPDMEKAAADGAKALREMNGGKDIKAVDPAALKALLPAEIAGAKRSNVESTHVNQMGMDIATTKCRFEAVPPENDDGSTPLRTFELQITDVGNVSGALGMGLTAWTAASYERETDTGYEKMTKYRGLPCEERYDREGKNGSMKLFVAKRFVVEMHGEECTMEQIKAAVDALDVSKLEALVK